MAGNKAFLIKKLVNLKFKEGASIAEHLNEIHSILNQLVAMKMVLDVELQALLLLSSLPESWEMLVVSLSNTVPHVLKDVTHVLNLRLNLISCGKLDDKGYENHFWKGRWKLSKGSLIVAMSEKKATLYRMKAHLFKGKVNTILEDSSPNLWHQRLGHMSEKGIQVLENMQLLPGMKGTSIEPCDHCLSGKQHRQHKWRNIPAFGDWDYANDLPITQYFESATQAGLLRHRSSGEGDLYKAGDLCGDDLKIPPRSTVVHRRKVGNIVIFLKFFFFGLQIEEYYI
ncbi:hypothetical protein HHK36_027184 [Tetracentron sinense]|uniref:GAG-pre-integrase domain-containing protein n=1 Tax=Tetracentron sinense TaxID=13715 RepID=A0A834YI98_TETSI|nr:hypothetical protein HHK36_027184 [Tetracentron sinense]